MASTKKTILLGLANEGQINFEVKNVETWEPKKISYMGTSVYFEHGGSFFSMKKQDFKDIFTIK